MAAGLLQAAASVPAAVCATHSTAAAPLSGRSGMCAPTATAAGSTAARGAQALGAGASGSVSLLKHTWLRAAAPCAGLVAPPAAGCGCCTPLCACCSPGVPACMPSWKWTVAMRAPGTSPAGSPSAGAVLLRTCCLATCSDLLAAAACASLPLAAATGGTAASDPVGTRLTLSLHLTPPAGLDTGATPSLHLTLLGPRSCWPILQGEGLLLPMRLMLLSRPAAGAGGGTCWPSWSPRKGLGLLPPMMLLTLPLPTETPPSGILHKLFDQSCMF